MEWVQLDGPLEISQGLLEAPPVVRDPSARAKRLRVRGIELEGASRNLFRSSPVPVEHAKDGGVPRVGFGQIRRELECPLDRLASLLVSDRHGLPAVSADVDVSPRHLDVRERERGIDRDRLLQVAQPLLCVFLCGPLDEIAPLKIETMSLRVLGAVALA